MSEHWTDCWWHHHACAIAYIAELEARLRKTPSNESGGTWGAPCGSEPLQGIVHPNGEHVTLPIYFDAFAEEETIITDPELLVHDHIEAPVVSKGPTWAYRAEEPPSVTP